MRRRKLLSLFLSLCLCLSLLPTAALAEDVQTEPLTEAAVTFPAPQAGDRIIEKIWKATASGLTFSSAGRGLWKNGTLTELGSTAVYEAGSTYLLEFRFYQETPLTELAAVTCNGQPVTLLADDAALGTALREYNGTSDTYYAYTTVMDFSTGGTTIEDAGLLFLYAFVHIPLTTTEVSSADALRTAIETGTDDIVKLTNDITIEARLDIARDVTVDLNGCILRYDETANPDSIFRVKAGKLTLTDSAPTASHSDASLPAGGLITGGKGERYDGGGGGQHYYRYYGGGVYVEAGASFVLAGGTIYACGVQSGAISAFGGGIYAEGGSVTMSGGAIRNCAVSAGSSASGGGIYLTVADDTDPSFTMTGGVISGCSARHGGGIAADPCAVQITGGSIENCKASERGGGLLVGRHADGQVSVLDAAISGCEAKRGGGVYLGQFAELELRENARITGCTATEKDDTEAGAIEYGAAVYMYLGNTYTANYPGTFLYANGGRVEGTVYVGPNYRDQRGIKATNAIDHTDGQPTVFTGDVYCEGDIRGGSFYGSVTVSHDSLEDWGNFKNFWSNLSGGSFYGPVYTECHVSGGTYYAGLTLERNAKLSGKPIQTEGLDETTNTPAPDGKPVTVTYGYGELGGIYAQQIVQTGETAIRPTDPDGKNLTFTGWYTDSDCTNPYDFTQAVTGNMTLYAGWKEFVLGILITDQNGNEVYVTNENYTDVLGDGTVSYTWGGFNSSEIPNEYWDDNKRYVTDAAIEKLLTGEEIPGVELSKLTLNGAKLQKIEAFCVPDSSNMYLWYFPIELKGENQITYSGTDAALDWSRGTALAFAGDGSLTVDAPNAKTAVAFGDNGRYYQRGGAVTLNAKDYGIAESPYDFTFTDGSLTIQAGNPENSGSGALCNADTFFHHCSITENAAFLLGDSADDPVKFYPPFNRESLFDQYMNALDAETISHEPYYMSLFTSRTVNFDSNGGSTIESQTVAYGKTLTPVIPTKSGYTFAGWYLGDTKYDFAAPVTENLTLTAKWTTNTYTLTFDTDGGSDIAPITQDYGTAITAPADPTRTGYTFAGWTPEIPATMPAENMTIKAKWTVNQYTLTFDTDGGSTIDPITQDYGTAITAPADPTRTGYTFAGWTPEIPATMPAENMTIKAKWTVNQYTITYDLDGGTAEGNPASYTVESGAITLAEPTKPGYTFTGWSGTDLEGADNRSVTIPAGSTGDRSYTAHWQVNTVYSSLRFETRGGSALATLALPYGSRVDLTKYVPTREGFAFTGWYTDKELTKRVTSLTLTNSTVVYAGWNPFTDVGSGDWYYEDVLYVYNQGLMEGTGADTFSPDAAVTRGQVVTILWRMAGSPVVNFAMNFTDVTEDTWCAEAIRWAASEGIAQGFADGSFGQDVYVSREQLAAFLYREVQRQGGGFTGMWYFPLNYPDMEELGAFADEAMHWCVMTGVLQGTADGRLAPKATADRAQLSAILHRYLTVEK